MHALLLNTLNKFDVNYSFDRIVCKYSIYFSLKMSPLLLQVSLLLFLLLYS